MTTPKTSKPAPKVNSEDMKGLILHPHEIRRLIDCGEVTLWRVMKPQPHTFGEKMGWEHTDLTGAAKMAAQTMIFPKPSFTPGQRMFVKRNRLKAYASFNHGELTIEITSVQAKQVQEASDDDAAMTGISPIIAADGPNAETCSHRAAFVNHWDRDNPKHKFESNPWCWVAKARKAE